MVDFQSRDRRRGPGDDEDDKPEDDESEETAETEEAEPGTEDTNPDAQTESVEYEADTAGGTLAYAVVTVGGDRSLEADPAGDAAIDAIEQVGDAVVTRELLAPAYDGVQQSLNTLTDRKDVDAIVTVGGTGVEPDDVTVGAAVDLFDKRLPGFGELFRVFSHDHDGTAVVRTRATAGTIDDVPVFCLPGTATAVRRGVEEIVVAEAPELVDLASEGDDASDDTDETADPGEGIDPDSSSLL